MATAVKCDGPDCREATQDFNLGGWIRITVQPIRDPDPALPAGDYDFHAPECLRKWVTANAKKGAK